MAQLVKYPPAMQETWVRTLSWEDPLENGNPLQYSGLENSMDRIVHGVAKSWTRLSDFPFRDLSGGLVVKNPPSSAEDTGSTPGWETKIPTCCGVAHVLWSPCSATREA